MSMVSYLNTGTLDAELGASGVEFTQISPDNDQLIFTAGSTEVDDGEDLPSATELIQAGVRWTGSQIIVSGYFLSDLDANELKQATLMGNVNKRYVLAFDFDGATASEPTLEFYDDENLDSIDNTMLGAGTASNSWVKGITTTDGLPGVGWATSAAHLAGSGDGNFLLLNNNNGALVGADTLYANIAIIVPASASNSGFSNTPIMAIKWLEN